MRAPYFLKRTQPYSFHTATEHSGKTAPKSHAAAQSLPTTNDSPRPRECVRRPAWFPAAFHRESGMEASTAAKRLQPSATCGTRRKPSTEARPAEPRRRIDDKPVAN